MERTDNRPLLLLLDQESVYRDQLALRLASLAGDGLQIVCREADQVPEQGLVDRTLICLFDHRAALLLERSAWPQATRFYLLGDEAGEHRVSRSMGVKALWEKIRPTDREGWSAGVTRSSAHHLDLVHSYQREARDAWTLATLEQRLGQGQQVYFLPLMPTFLVPDLAEAGEGETLSDLLLTLETGQPLDHNRLGRVFFAHPRGYLVPRLPERADDLIASEADSLTSLVRLLAERIAKAPAGTSGLVVCDGLPLATVSRLAVYAGRLYIDPLQKGPYASDAARREIGLLLATLPSSCRVEELPFGEHS